MTAQAKKPEKTAHTESGVTKTRPPNQASQAPLLLLAIVLSFLALSSAGYAVFSGKQVARQSSLLAQSAKADMAQFSAEHTQATTQVGTAIQAMQQTEDELASRLHVLTKQIHTSDQQRLYQSTDWLLLKARYYLELAQINAHWSDDLHTTAALLQEADNLLTSIPQQQLFPIRQAIAEEITQINTIRPVDTIGLLSKLGAAEKMLGQIPIQKPGMPTDDRKTASKAQPSNEPTQGTTWKTRLATSLSELKKLVIIRRHDDEIAPLLTTSQEAALRSIVAISLQEAQWALLQKNEAVYQMALTQAIDQVQQGFDSTNSATETLITLLKTVQAVSLVQQKPVTGQALTLLNQHIEATAPNQVQTKPAGDKGQ